MPSSAIEAGSGTGVEAEALNVSDAVPEPMVSAEGRHLAAVQAVVVTPPVATLIFVRPIVTLRGSARSLMTSEVSVVTVLPNTAMAVEPWAVMAASWNVPLR